MKKLKMIVAVMLAVLTIASVAVVSANAATSTKEKTSASGITVHYYSESGVPTIYYWNSLPQNIKTDYPGPAMTAEGSNWYKYTFSNVTKINMLFVVNGVQSVELTRNSGEYWYKGKRWYNSNPGELDSAERLDFRENSIYFVITTRFFDGDTSNNVHCWEDKKANNPDSDTPWRGDFKGLIQKMDYIKALGFTAIWITPVVENASGYDYHGYHAFDFTKVDPRYESNGVTFQDVIDAAHEKGLKIVQDVVWNHTGNFGEANLAPMFKKVYNSIQDLGSIDCMQLDPDGVLAKYYPNYDSLNPDTQQYPARLDCMKTDAKDSNFNYHHSADMSYESYTEQTGQMAGDCVDINTENQKVADYLNEAYMEYVNMGVDAFRLDTEKHISRWSLNNAFFPVYNKVENFWIFGEVCARVRDVWNHNQPADSCPFYTWKETESKWMNNWSTTDWQSNLNNSIQHFQDHTTTEGVPTSDNTFLNGITYHTPDYSKSNGTSTIDFSMHWNFENATSAFGAAKNEDKYFNDSTWNVMYVDSHDYGPDACQTTRFNFGTQAWAENLDLMFTFRGIPCLYYGSETEFMKGAVIDVGPNAPLATTGRAYYGDNLEGNVTATDFGEYTASGTVASTLSSPLAVHVRQLNMIRQAVPALQKGQYTVDSNYVSGNMAYIRRYTNSSEGIDSLACVTISGGATFKNIPNGTYIDAVTGDTQNVTNGTLTVGSIGSANMRCYVCCASNFTGIDGRIGETGTYLK